MEDLKSGKVNVSSPCSVVIDEWRDGDCVKFVLHFDVSMGFFE